MLTATLCVRAASFTCALHLPDVVETMRPLPVEALGGAPPYVLGLARVRGQPAVVVDAALLLSGAAHQPVHRFVSLRSAGRPMVLAVEAVLGIRAVEMDSLQPMPQGLGCHAAARALGTLDQSLLLALDIHQLLRDADIAANRALGA